MRVLISLSHLRWLCLFLVKPIPNEQGDNEPEERSVKHPFGRGLQFLFPRKSIVGGLRFLFPEPRIAGIEGIVLSLVILSGIADRGNMLPIMP